MSQAAHATQDISKNFRQRHIQLTAILRHDAPGNISQRSGLIIDIRDSIVDTYHSAGTAVASLTNL